MLPRCPAERPQGILQPFGQGDEALATEHDMGVLKPAIGQPEVVEAMIERRSGNADTQLTHVGEVGKAGLAGFVGLAEDDLLLLAMNGPPGADPALQGAADSSPDFRVATQHLLEDRDRPHVGRRLQHRHHFRLKYAGQGIRPATAADSLLLRWKAGILLDAIGGRRAERRLGGGHGRGIGLTVLHIEPHLVIGNVSAGQASDSSWRKNHLHNQPAAITRRRGPSRIAPSPGLVTPVGLRPPCVTSPGEILSSCLTLQCHPDCRAAGDPVSPA
jgi:hypothetical protein